MQQDITGLILAGGRARRMGGVDKGLVELAGKPMVAHVVHRISSQVGTIIINANRNLAAYQQWSSMVVSDKFGHYDGPLAGIATGLALADTEFVLTVPCDSPLLCEDYADRMYKQLTAERVDIAVASNGRRAQPVFLLMRRGLMTSLSDFLRAGGRKIDEWYEGHPHTVVDFSDRPETFLNINTNEDKEHLAAKFGPDV